MDVSVIVINFNTFALTSACIRSVYEKTSGVTFELILVDNGSHECSPTRFKEEFPDIKLIISETNLGFAKGNNLGLQKATGRTILLLNSDTQLLNNAIALAHTRLLKSPESGALAGKLYYPDRKVQHNVQRFPSIKLLLLEVLRLFHLMPLQKRGEVLMGGYFSYQIELFADWTWATFLLIRRDVLDNFPNGRLHEDFFMYEEDKQWCLFMRQLGLKVLFSPQPHILHHASGSSSAKEYSFTVNTSILHNEFRFLTMTKGVMYARIFFLLKTVQYLTSGYTQAKAMAKHYLRIALSGPPATQ